MGMTHSAHRSPEPFEKWARAFDILLVQPDQGAFVRSRIFHPGVEIPLNLTSLAAYLERDALRCEILDLRLFDNPQRTLERVIAEYRFPVMGISAYTSEIENAGKVAGVAKRLRPEVVTVVGGYHASAVPQETLAAYPHFDYLIRGEGEVSLSSFIRKVLAGEDLKDHRGLVYRNASEIVLNPKEPEIADLDSLPLTARDKIPIHHYQPKPATGNFMRLPTTGIMSSRGCPFECAYCSKGVWGRSIRFRSPGSVVEEIESCIERYGIRDFRFYDDALTNPAWDLESFCRMIVARGLDITWNCYSRVDHVTEEKLQWMKDAGCYHIKYGVEFGTEKALRLTHKNTTLDDARRAVALTKKMGIECKASFIFGVPGETVEDCAKTLQFALELSPDLASFYPFDLFPGTHFYALAKQNMKDHCDKTLPRQVSERLAQRAYYRFYLRPRYIAQRAKRVFRHPKREIVLLSNGLKMMGKFFLKSVLKDERF